MAAPLQNVSNTLNRKLFDIPRLSPAHDIARQGPFKLAAVRWAWQYWFRALAPSGRYFFLATILFFFYGGLTLEPQSFVPFAYALVIWTIAEIARFLERPKVEIRAHHPDRIAAGERLNVEVEVRNLKSSALAGGQLMAHRLPDAIDFNTLGIPIPSLDSGEATAVHLELSPRRRGAYELHGFRVETAFPFGLLFSASAREVRSKLLVYPKFYPLERLELPQSRRYQPGGVAFVSARGESVEYVGNRDYREGDAVRDIDWRATARLSRPIVREFREEYFLRAAVVLDTHVPLPQPEACADFERAVSLCAACGDYMNRADYLVDILAAGPNLYHLLAGRGLASLDQMLDILARVDSTEQSPWDTLAPAIEANLEQITSVICLFLDWDESRRTFATLLQSGGGAVKIFVLRDKSNGPTTLPTEGTWPGEIVVLGEEEWRNARQL
ncbi:hypothetical protein IAD21_04261 [Abditibacteriota bacterium]|nr:hypothetical protein IAD21_04261 [Abditibacteriota bacterium]